MSDGDEIRAPLRDYILRSHSEGYYERLPYGYAQGGYIHGDGAKIPDVLLSRIIDPGYIITREQAKHLSAETLRRLSE